MTDIIQSLSDLSGRYDALFCDLWGCLHDGVKPFPAAVAALQAFRAGGGKVILVTNAPRPKPAVIRHLDSIGVPRDTWDDIATSGDAAQFAMYMGAVGTRIHHIGAPKDEPFFTEHAPDLNDLVASTTITRVALAEAEGIVCTGLVDDLTETPADYRAQLLLGKVRGLKLLCANPDIIVDMGHQRLYCAGALAQDYDEMGGQSLYYGKPHPPVYDIARRRLGLEDPRILCVGDGIATDVQGGMAEGLDTLFITGGIAAPHFGPNPASPDPTLLRDWLTDQRLTPTWAIGLLR